MKTLSLCGKETGQVTVEAGSLAAGNYFYTLIADGKKVDSKQMTIVK